MRLALPQSFQRQDFMGNRLLECRLAHVNDEKSNHVYEIDEIFGVTTTGPAWRTPLPPSRTAEGTIRRGCTAHQAVYRSFPETTTWPTTFICLTAINCLKRGKRAFLASGCSLGILSGIRSQFRSDKDPRPILGREPRLSVPRGSQPEWPLAQGRLRRITPRLHLL